MNICLLAVIPPNLMSLLLQVHGFQSLSQALLSGKLFELTFIGETQYSNSELSQNSYFFPSKKRAECDNLNRESSKSKFPGIFAITF